jgi:hypothetical protein
VLVVGVQVFMGVPFTNGLGLGRIRSECGLIPYLIAVHTSNRIPQCVFTFGITLVCSILREAAGAERPSKLTGIADPLDLRELHGLLFWSGSLK